LKMVDTYLKDRLVIVSSNLQREYDFCENAINLQS
jgi:hypothetical protein